MGMLDTGTPSRKDTPQPMSVAASEQEIRELIRQLVLELAPGSVTGASANPDLVNDLDYNSLAVLELAFTIEDEFQLEPLDEETARSIPTLYDVQDHVITKLRERGELPLVTTEP